MEAQINAGQVQTAKKSNILQKSNVIRLQNP